VVQNDDARPWISWKNLALALLGASGFLVQLWVGYIDGQIGIHNKRLNEHDWHTAIMEAEHKRLKEDHEKLENQYYELCRKTRSC